MTPEIVSETLTPAFFQNMSSDREITFHGARFGPMAPDPVLVIPAIATLIINGKMTEEASFPRDMVVDEIVSAMERGAKAIAIGKTADRMNIMLEGIDWDISMSVLVPEA